jgi:hypothetical protein
VVVIIDIGCPPGLPSRRAGAAAWVLAVIAAAGTDPAAISAALPRITLRRDVSASPAGFLSFMTSFLSAARGSHGMEGSEPRHPAHHGIEGFSPNTAVARRTNTIRVELRRS